MNESKSKLEESIDILKAYREELVYCEKRIKEIRQNPEWKLAMQNIYMNHKRGNIDIIPTMENEYRVPMIIKKWGKNISTEDKKTQGK